MTEDQHKQQGRRLILIDRMFQFRMLRRATAPVFLTTIVVVALIWMTSAVDRQLHASELRWPALAVLAGFNIVSFLGVAWSLFLYSSRLAGPLVNLSRTLKSVAGGDLTVRARVRKDDELQEHAEHLNTTIMSLQDRIRRINQFCKFAHSTIDDMRTSDPDSAELGRMMDLVRSIEESVEDFRV